MNETKIEKIRTLNINKDPIRTQNAKNKDPFGGSGNISVFLTTRKNQKSLFQFKIPKISESIWVFLAIFEHFRLFLADLGHARAQAGYEPL